MRRLQHAAASVALGGFLGFGCRASPVDQTVGSARAADEEGVAARLAMVAHKQLAAACATRPDAVVRVFTPPLTTGAFVDVPCAALAGEVVPVAMTDGQFCEAERFEVPIVDGGPVGTVQILGAGHNPIAAACAAQPDAAVQLEIPSKPGTFAHVPCNEVLSPREAGVADGSTGNVEVQLTPVGLACGLLSIGVGLASTWACQNYPDAWCPWPAAGGTTLINIACLFL